MARFDNFVVLVDDASGDTDGEALQMDGARAADVVVHVSQIDSGRVRFEGSVDGENWSVVQATQLSDGTSVTSTTASGLYRVDAAGLGSFRTPYDNHSSGNCTVRAVSQYD